MKIKYNNKFLDLLEKINNFLSLLTLFILIGLFSININEKTLNIILCITPILINIVIFIFKRCFLKIKIKKLLLLKNIKSKLKSKYFKSNTILRQGENFLYETQIDCKMEFVLNWWKNELTIYMYFYNNKTLSSISNSILEYTNIEFNKNSIFIEYKYENNPKTSNKEKRKMNIHKGSCFIEIKLKRRNIHDINMSYLNDFKTRSSFGEINIDLSQFNIKK